jgi:hypothetical protein
VPAVSQSNTTFLMPYAAFHGARSLEGDRLASETARLASSLPEFGRAA